MKLMRFIYLFEKPMEFLRTIRKSIFDRDFYAKAQTADFRSALKQYTLFILCIAFITALPVYISFFTALSQIKESSDIPATALSLYPDELVLRLENGHMTSNVAEPYTIPMPESSGMKQSMNLLVINTRGAVTPADFDLYNTSAILGGDAVWVYDREKDKIEIQKFDMFGKDTLVINKQKVGEWVGIAWNIGKKILVVFMVFLPFFLFSFLWFAYLLYLLFGAVIIWVIAKIRKVDLSYSQSYKIGLYLITLPILYSTLSVASLSFLRIPFLFTIILAIVAYLNLAPTSTPPIGEEKTDTLKEDETETVQSEIKIENPELKK